MELNSYTELRFPRNDPFNATICCFPDPERSDTPHPTHSRPDCQTLLLQINEDMISVCRYQPQETNNPFGKAQHRRGLL
jgi:hypothetical protein